MDRVHNIYALLLWKTHHKLPSESGTDHSVASHFLSGSQMKKTQPVSPVSNEAEPMSEPSFNPC